MIKWPVDPNHGELFFENINRGLHEAEETSERERVDCIEFFELSGETKCDGGGLFKKFNLGFFL